MDLGISPNLHRPVAGRYINDFLANGGESDMRFTRITLNGH